MQPYFEYNKQYSLNKTKNKQKNSEIHLNLKCITKIFHPLLVSFQQYNKFEKVKYINIIQVSKQLKITTTFERPNKTQNS